jgi:hypothetical protein
MHCIREQARSHKGFGSGAGFTLKGLGANDTTPIVIGRAPFADVFDMAKTPKANLLLIQPTHAAAR